MLWLRQSPFAKSGWGLIYANKTRGAQVLLAGITIIGEYKWAINTLYLIYILLLSVLILVDKLTPECDRELTVASVESTMTPSVSLE
jgi:hypothetical protein